MKRRQLVLPTLLALAAAGVAPLPALARLGQAGLTKSVWQVSAVTP